MELVQRGKKLLIIFTIGLLAISFLTTAINGSLLYREGQVQEATYKLTQGAIRFGLEYLLLVFLFKGHRWAKVLAAILCGVTGGMSIMLYSAGGWVMVALAIPFLAGFVLLLSKPVAAYQRYKREGAAAVEAEGPAPRQAR